MEDHYIRYNIYLGSSPESGVIYQTYEGLDSILLRHIGFFPRSFEQLALGWLYYCNNQLLLRSVGYFTVFCFADTLEQYADKQDLFYECSATVNIICTDDRPSLDIICKHLKRVHNDRSVYYVYGDHAELLGLPNVCTTAKSVIECLKELLPSVLPEDIQPIPENVNRVDKGYLFNPALVNTLTLHNMFGDFAFEYKRYTEEDAIAEQTIAEMHKDEFMRQQMLVSQNSLINHFELQAYAPVFEIYQSVIDQISAPWIIVFPYTSRDVRTVIKRIPGNEDALRAAEIFRKIIDKGNTKNYTFLLERNKDDRDTNPLWYPQACRFIFGPRAHCLDALGLLHSSLRFSPYVRLPFLGKELNNRLSSFATKNIEDLIGSKGYKPSLCENMEDLGNRIQEATMSEQLIDQLNDLPRQVAVVSDLPIEWTMLHGVPFGFTHDICRIPEMPISAGMQHYVINMIQDVLIDEDIMSKTLVVYGSRDTSFRIAQDECDRLAAKLGFHTAECLSADAFYSAIKRYKPLLLLIDTHGDMDEKTRQTYMYMGTDKIYPQSIVDHHVQVPIVFISACNTAPVYDMTNSLANGFIESGSLAVTSTYMPIGVGPAANIYLSLIGRLSIACQRPIFSNWVAFVSYVLRTSHIRSAYPAKLTTKELQDSYCEMCEDVRIFSKRRSVYESLKKGLVVSGHMVKLPTIPHYLMYSTIGRADLIKFVSFVKPYLTEVYANLQTEEFEDK